MKMAIIKANRARNAAANTEATRIRERDEDRFSTSVIERTRTAENSADRTLRALKVDATTKNTEAIRSAAADQLKIDNARKEAAFELKEDKAARQVLEDAATTMDFILGAKVDSAAARSQAEIENAKPDGKIVYFVNEDGYNEWDAYNLNHTHVDPKTKKPLTIADLKSRAAAADMTFNEYMTKYVKHFR